MKLLENWFIFNDRVYGKVYNDNRFSDGSEIVTSNIVLIDKNNILTTKSGTHYQLGKQAK